MKSANAFVLQGKLLDHPFMNDGNAKVWAEKLQSRTLSKESNNDFKVTAQISLRYVPFDTVESMVEIVREAAPEASVTLEAFDYLLRLEVQ